MGDIGKVIAIDMDSITLMRGVHEFKVTEFIRKDLMEVKSF